MKFLRIDMTAREIKEEPVPEKYAKYGGRALTSRIVSGEVAADCNPLGPRNKLVVANGLLCGTSAPNSGRISIGAKSPLTGGIKESNVGGNVGVFLARSGVRALVFEGMPAEGELYFLIVKPDGAVLEDASAFRGMGNYEMAEKLRGEYGEKTAILCVGPAGEQRLAASAIIATDIDGMPSRAAGRGGMGAVLGSKGIKAVICFKTPSSRPGYKDADEFNRITKEFSKKLIKEKAGLTRFGTAGMVKAANMVEGMPTKNFSRGSFERAADMNGDSLYEIIMKRKGKPSRACHQGCVIRCSNVFLSEDGEYVTSSLEYETMVMNGPNLGIGSLDAIARIDRALDDVGLDSIDTGAALGIAMETGLLEWGDAEGVISLIGEVQKGTVAGRLIGSGAAIVGKVLGARRIPAVKGQAMAAYDPRTFKGMGCAYATSPMGADHTAGPAIPGRPGLDPDKRLELTESEGQVELSRDLQIMVAVCDSLGYCFFVGPDVENMKRSAELLNALYGWDYKYEDVLDIGVSTLNIEKAFNREAGISPAQDRLPEFLCEESLPASGRKFDIPHKDLRDLDYNL